jgi:hypothetical protein
MAWKIVEDEKAVKPAEYVTFAQARKYFAVDSSGSTGGSVLRAEAAFAEAVYKAGEGSNASQSAVTKWGTSCDDPTKNWDKVKWISNGGGTRPSQILINSLSLSAIRTSDIWFLITDGEVWEQEVHDLARLGLNEGIFACPTVFVITSAAIRSAPSTVDVSVVRPIIEFTEQH